MLRFFSIFAAAASLSMSMSACTEDSPITIPPVNNDTTIEIDRSAFAKGADVSWVTMLESKGVTFKNAAGTQKELMTLLRDDCSVNAIRLRVWVNPAQGWNSIDDVVVKARRANNLGLRLMIDFHMSDTWADPGAQAVPAAWAAMGFDDLKTAMVAHINEMLTRLKALGIEPEWVQIGNETRTGMMYPLGNTSDYPANFAKLVTAGNDAVKAIFPDCKVVVQCDCGNQANLYTYLFGTVLGANKASYDMIGMSLYPDADNWQQLVKDCIANIKNCYATYGKRVVVCEVGMDYDLADICNKMITALKKGCEEAGCVDGIFYWEPEATVETTDGYRKGCFVDGAPTVALDAFKN